MGFIRGGDRPTLLNQFQSSVGREREERAQFKNSYSKGNTDTTLELKQDYPRKLPENSY